ncbi:hypothetical protein O181_082732 [Austropuccinia psidii MF-1]|uniref:Uncharacterized protein n=1 Tax=Austropuccinia psidii MF-1 TaxID=1389203 RepID=A0A9Q3FT43_9BASI|nr:hypothetical protein [Austropuccinia psidii MF-1]
MLSKVPFLTQKKINDLLCCSNRKTDYLPYTKISDSMINLKILRKCRGELENAIKCRFVEPCSSEDYINSMEDIITRTRIGKTWTRNFIGSKMVPKISRGDKRPKRPVLKCHNCGKKEEYDQNSAVSEETPVEDYSIENIRVFFEVTELHTHLPQYCEDFYNLRNLQDSRVCKTKPARGKGYTGGSSCITSVFINDIEAEVNLDTGAFCTCIGKAYLQVILPEWRNHLLPIEGVQFSSSSNDMYPLGILEINIVSPHPAGSLIMNKEIVVIDNFTSQHIIVGDYYLNIYGININTHKDRYFPIGENKRQKFSFSNIPKQISIVSSTKHTYKEEFVTDQLVEAQINPSFSPRMRKELITVLYTYKNAFASDNEPLGTIKWHEVDITLNIDRPYPPVIRRAAYPASPRAR